MIEIREECARFQITNRRLAGQVRMIIKKRLVFRNGQQKNIDESTGEKKS